MKLINAGFLILLSIWYGYAFAGEQRQIELNDGSVIMGEIVSLSNGVYTINSTLGTLQIEDAKIRAIHSKSPSSTEGNSLLALPGDLQALQGLQSLLMGNSEAMNTILSLQNDPAFQAALQDSEIMGAVMSGDFSALINNPTFMKLLEHQKVQEITEEIKE